MNDVKEVVRIRQVPFFSVWFFVLKVQVRIGFGVVVAAVVVVAMFKEEARK